MRKVRDVKTEEEKKRKKRLVTARLNQSY